MRISSSITCLLVLTITASLAAQEQRQGQNPSQQRNQPGLSAGQAGEAGQTGSEEQTIRGRVVGVARVGEAIIDPQSNQAMIAQMHYITVLGTPAEGDSQHQGRQGASPGQPSQQSPGQQQAGQQQAGQQSAGQQSAGQNRESGAAGGSSMMRESLYVIAITPQTNIQAGRSQGQSDRQSERQSGQQQQAQQQQAQQQRQQQQQQQQAAGQAGSEAALEQLVIGDRVRVRFNRVAQIRGQAIEGSQQRAAAYRGESHGRNRIVLGEAQMINILPESGSSEAGSSQQRRSSESGSSQPRSSESSSSPSQGQRPQ